MSMTKSSQSDIKWYAMGDDFGNSEMCGTLLAGGRRARIRIPTAFAKVNPSQMRNLGVEIDKSDLHTIIFEDESQHWGVGHVALAQASNSMWDGRGDIERYASRHALRGLLTMAAKLIPDRDFGLYVVCGLPAETFIKNAGLRKKIKAALDGTYCFSVDNKKKWRTATVEIGNVIMEGAGALVSYGGKRSDRAQESGVIDIGGRTTDLFVARGQVPVTEYCKGRPLGVVSASEAFKNAYEDRYDVPISELQAREVMSDFVLNKKSDAKKKTYPTLTAYGAKISPDDIDALAKECVSSVASEIVSFVASAWRQSDRGAVAATFSPVLCIGGGYHYFFDDLKARIPHLQAPEDPSHANSDGYAEVAKALLAKRDAKIAEQAAAEATARAEAIAQTTEVQ